MQTAECRPPFVTERSDRPLGELYRNNIAAALYTVIDAQPCMFRQANHDKTSASGHSDGESSDLGPARDPVACRSEA